MKTILSLSINILNNILDYLTNVDIVCFILSHPKLYKERFSFRLQLECASIPETGVVPRPIVSIFEDSDFNAIEPSEAIRRFYCAQTFISTKQTHFKNNTFRKMLFKQLNFDQPISTFTWNSLEQSSFFQRKSLISYCIPSDCTNLIIDQSDDLSGVPSTVSSLCIGDNVNDIYCAKKWNTPNFKKSYRLNGNSLPKSLRTLYLGGHFNDIINVNILPDGITHLVFGSYFNSPLAVGSLPKQLKILQFGEHFNQPLSVGLLPDTLEELDTPAGRSMLPANLKSLNLGSRFDRRLNPYTLPASLERLMLSTMFDHGLNSDTLPANLKELTISFNYNKVIPPGALPNGLKKLRILSTRCQLLEGAIPASVETLYLGTDQVLVGLAIDSLNLKKYIVNSDNEHRLSSTIESFTCMNNSYYNNPDGRTLTAEGFNLHSLVELNLQNLTLDHFDHLRLPPTLKRLYMPIGRFNQLLPPHFFPDGLEFIDFGHNLVTSIPVVPNTVKHMVFRSRDVKPTNRIPPSVKKVEFHSQLPEFPVAILSDGIETITLDENCRSSSSMNRICSCCRSVWRVES
ncbi:hypothetical protein PPL_12026 [Heterostelium album PN500]|uniref:Uncharacterized protein n=1 Tax=Heterostelium pallidum (strain ATCC 26659 / Pp 5 / PN500) TaxID=670386 RepID=D3BV54_HETP5|nr:hypothetical protein PPL_12026 [Heterostelium album PN500]EFA74992.1 hypothetical protein PPL_12026 [Heterostelium album PN500]|eukprot:XP_020427126.1 hypothetical protein PPL_12026 [Heterostelium album PN500]